MIDHQNDSKWTINHKFWAVVELELALPNLNKYTWNFQTLFRGCVNIFIVGIYKALDMSISLTKLQLKNLQEGTAPDTYLQQELKFYMQIVL